MGNNFVHRRTTRSPSAPNCLFSTSVPFWSYGKFYTLKAWDHVIPSNRGGRARPSHKELQGKLREALALVRSHQWRPADIQKLQADWNTLEDELGAETTLPEDQFSILTSVMEEIRPEHYKGDRPPKRSYEPVTKGLEMFAFRWDSTFFGQTEMYFKFSVSGIGKSRRIWIYSLHPNRDE